MACDTSTVSGEKLWIDPSVTNGFTGATAGTTGGKIEIGADSATLLASKKDGWATSSSDKILRIYNAGAQTAIYNIVILGTSV